MRPNKPELMDVNPQRLKDVADRAKASLDPEDAELIERVFESYEYVAGLIQEKSMSIAMIGLLKYGSGLPFNRLEGLQGNLEIPLPASTQWDVVHSFSI